MRKLIPLLAVVVLTLAAASAADASSIVTYPLPEYEVSGHKYVNEDITNLVATPNGDIWWDAFAPGNIGEIEPAHASPGTSSGQRIVTGSGGGNDPEGLTLGPDGDLYVGLGNPGGLWKLEPAAANPSPILVNNKTITNANRPIEMAFSPKNGNLFFTSRANTVVEALNPGFESLTSTGEVSEPYPWGIKVDSAGNAWIGEDGRAGNGNGLIGEIPYASGNELLQYATPDSPSEPQRLTIDHSGDVWFIDRTANSIGELVPAAAKAGTSAGVSEYKIPLPTAGVEEQPYDITTAADGSIWFTESAKSLSNNSPINQIGEVMPVSGQSTVVFSMMATPDGEQPQAIVGDAAGNIWYSAGGGNSSDELGEVVGAAGSGGTKTEEKGKEEKATNGGGGGTTTTASPPATSPTTSAAVVETVTTSSGQSITLATAPGEAGYAELDKHLLGGLSGNDIAKLLANGGFSIQIPLTYPAYAGSYSATGQASPSGIPGYEGEGVNGGEFPGSGGFALLAKSHHAKSHTHARTVVLFHYSHTYTKSGTYTAKVKFTAAGMKLLRAAERAHHKLKVAVKLSLTAKGHTPILQKLSTTLKPGSRRKAKH